MKPRISKSPSWVFIRWDVGSSNYTHCIFHAQYLGAVVAADSPLGFVFHVFLTHAMSAEQKQDPDSQITHLQKITKFRLLYILFKVNVDFPMKPKFFISSQKVWVVQLLLKKKIKKLFKAQKNQV